MFVQQRPGPIPDPHPDKGIPASTFHPEPSTLHPTLGGVAYMAAYMAVVLVLVRQVSLYTLNPKLASRRSGTRVVTRHMSNSPGQILASTFR